MDPKPHPSLPDLPSEVLLLIFKNVKRPSELKMLMCLCKRFHALCAPHLYKEISLDRYEYQQDPFFHRKFDSMIADDNAGVQYIRHVRIGTPGDWIPVAQPDYLVDHLIKALPPNNLRSIGFLDECGGSCRCNFLSDKNLTRIAERQQGIEELSLDSTRLQMEHMTPSLLNAVLNLKSLRSLRLCLHNFNLGPVYEVASRLARVNASLERLTICLGKQGHGRWDLTQDVRIKPRFWSFGLDQPIRLQSLTLINYDFNGFDIGPMTSTFDLSRLKSLEVSGCLWPDIFLNMLTNRPHWMDNLQSFTFRHFCYVPITVAMGTLERSLRDFLTSLRNGLTKLHIVLDRAVALPPMALLTETVHAKTLQSLLVVARHRFGTPAGSMSMNDRTIDLHPLKYSLDEVKKLCRSCLQLRQLSISLPRESGPAWYLELLEPLKHLRTFMDVPWLGFAPHHQVSRDHDSEGQQDKAKPEAILPSARRVYDVMDRVGVPLQVYATCRLRQSRATWILFVRERSNEAGWTEPQLVSRAELGYVVDDAHCDIVDVAHHFRGESVTTGF